MEEAVSVAGKSCNTRCLEAKPAKVFFHSWRNAAQIRAVDLIPWTANSAIGSNGASAPSALGSGNASEKSSLMLCMVAEAAAHSTQWRWASALVNATNKHSALGRIG